MAMAMKAVRTMVADMFRCTACGKPKVEMASSWKGRGTGRSGESVHAATRFGGEVCVCPPAPVDGAVVGRIAAAVRTWDCRNCGARVDEMIDGCLLCGYERKPCTSCDGSGVINSGPHPTGVAAEPCNNCDEGYYYPLVAEVAPVEDPNDCAGCGARPSVRDDEGNASYPVCRAGKETGAGYCGFCAREEGFKS